MNATIHTQSTLSPTFTARLREKLGGEWDVEAKSLNTEAAKEQDFVRLTTDYATMIGHENGAATAYPASKREGEAKLADQAGEKFTATRKEVGEGSTALLKEALDFAREGLITDFPDIRPTLQPYAVKDFGDGVLGLPMSFKFPMGDGSIGLSDRGLLVIDTTPGQDGMTVAWAHRCTPDCPQS